MGWILQVRIFLFHPFFLSFYIQPNVLTSTFLKGWHSPEHPWTVWHPRQRLWWRLHSNVLHGLWLGARSSWIEIGRGQFPAATTRLIMMIMWIPAHWYMSPFPLFLLCSHFYSILYLRPSITNLSFCTALGPWSFKEWWFFLRPCLSPSPELRYSCGATFCEIKLKKKISHDRQIVETNSTDHQTANIFRHNNSMWWRGREIILLLDVLPDP